jgi:hypothetical protein
MITGTPDLGFGSTGAMVSTVPVDYQVSPPIVNDPGQETHNMGGRAVAAHLVASETPAMVVAGHDHWLGGNHARRLVWLVSEQSPAELARFGMLVRRISDPSCDTDVLASCAVSSDRCQLLVRMIRGAPPFEYGLWTVGGPTLLAVDNVITRAVPVSAIDDGAGGARIAYSNGAAAVVSASGTNLRVAVFPSSGAPTVTDVGLAPAGNRLSGLSGLFVASVRFLGSGLSIALTAERTQPGLGAVSHGVILRLLANGSRDPAYGEDGLWVSPLRPTHRSFRATGETPNGVGGHDGSRVVLYGVVPDGGRVPRPGDPEGGLDDTFGTSGIATVGLPGQVRSCALISSSSRVWVAAEYVPSGGAPMVVVSRFAVADGALDRGFGEDGLSQVELEEPGLALGGLVMQPARLGVHPNPPQPARLILTVSRTTDGLDCTHLPTLLALTPNTGAPVESFGYGGTALLSGVGPPAAVLGDGSALAQYRVQASQAPATRFRRITADGRLGQLLDVDVPARGDFVHRFTPVDSDVLLVSGAGGGGGWVTRVNRDLAVDTTFGQGGIVTPRPGRGGVAAVLGTRADGSIVVQLSDGTDTSLCLLSKDGRLDTTYATNGFLPLEAFGHPGARGTGTTCFLDSDGQVIVVVHSTDPVTLGLRRVTAQGHYDARFGVGLPSVNPPASDRTVTLHAPPTEAGTGPAYSTFVPAGMGWLGSARSRSLYVVGTATAGGGLVNLHNGLAIMRPAYPVLVVSSWTQTGAVSTSITGGVQEGGVLPFQYWYATGVVAESPTSLIAFGGGGTPVTVQSQVSGGTPMTTKLTRWPGPALFRITHPGGIDFGFGDHGAAVIRTPDFVPSIFAGALSDAGDTLTLMHADLGEYKRDGTYRNRFGGLVRFT